MSILKELFGKLHDSQEVYIYTLTNFNNMEVRIINFGGIVTSIFVPDKEGNFDDVVLGYDNLTSYLKNPAYFGAIIGRCTNRIGGASFEINGVKYKLCSNIGKNHLHGGLKGFDKVLWKPKAFEDRDGIHLQLKYRSNDKEEGYPGNLDVKVTYTLMKDRNSLKIDYYAVSDKNTVVNLTNHSYFNLAGHASGNILSHKLMINADRITETDEKSIPTGKLLDVKGTPLDFTQMKEIGEGIDSNHHQIILAGGYDHNWVLNGEKGMLNFAAKVLDENSGRILELYTTKPGVQLYTGNYLNGSEIGKGEVSYKKRSGLCLETQYFPDAINHKNFPSPVLRKGEIYKHTTVYKFSLIGH